MPNLPTAAEIAELIEFVSEDLEARKRFWKDVIAEGDAERALAIAERLPALVAEIERVGAECTIRAKEVMKVYSERDRLSYMLYASMDCMTDNRGYVEECRLLSAERDRLAGDVERVTKERDDARTWADRLLSYITAGGWETIESE